MEITLKQLKLKGHGSFYLREGWLRKGILEIEKDPTFFSRKDTTDKLGVGANMVNAIKYYLLATGLAEVSYASNRKKQYTLTEDFGRIIFENDEYFEDVFSLWLLHYKIATNANMATTWYLFFNALDGYELKKEDIKTLIEEIIHKNLPNKKYSKKSLVDDINCIINTYKNIEYKDKTPEENLACPFSELGLIKEGTNFTGEKVLFKLKPSMEKLDKIIVLYVIVDNLKNKKSIDINSILEKPGNAGKVLNLDRTLLNQYLDLLKEEGFIHINRTAGLDQVYVNFEKQGINFKKPSDIIKYYYKENEGRTYA